MVAFLLGGPISTTFNPTDVYNNSNGTESTSSGYGYTPSSALGSSSTAGYNFPDFNSIIGNQNKAGNQMLSGQNQNVGNYLSSYANAINSQETAPAMWQRLANETGFNSLNKQALDINNTLQAIPQTYNNATRGFDVNNNQLDRIVGQETYRLAPIAQRATAQAQNAAGLMTNQMQLGQAQQQKELQPYTAEQSFLNDYLARQSSMFTQQNQNELAALTAKMQTGAQLSQAEQDRMNQLKIAEEGYANNLARAKLSAGTVLSPNQTYYNPFATSQPYNPTNPYILPA